MNKRMSNSLPDSDLPTCAVCGKNLAPPGGGTPMFCPSCGSDTRQPPVKAKGRDPRFRHTREEALRREQHGGTGRLGEDTSGA